MGQLVTALTEGRSVASVLIGGSADRGVLIALGFFDLCLFIARKFALLNVQRQPTILRVLLIYFGCLQFFLGNVRCAGGDVSAAPPSKQSQIKQCHPPERHFVPRAAPGGPGPPGSPILPRRNLIQTHFDRGFFGRS